MKYFLLLLMSLLLSCSTNTKRIKSFIAGWLQGDYNLETDFCNSSFIDANDYCTAEIGSSGKEHFGELLDDFIAGYTIERIYFLDHPKGEIAFAKIKSESTNRYLILEFLYTQDGLALQDLSIE